MVHYIYNADPVKILHPDDRIFYVKEAAVHLYLHKKGAKSRMNEITCF